MGLFHFARRKHVPVPGAAAKSDTAPLDLQAFILEPILTPSGLVDAPDHTPNVMDWVDHPGTAWHASDGDVGHTTDVSHSDSGLSHATDTPTADTSHDLVSGNGYGSGTDGTASIPDHQIEPITFHDASHNETVVVAGGGYGSDGVTPVPATDAPTPQPTPLGTQASTTTAPVASSPTTAPPNDLATLPDPGATPTSAPAGTATAPTQADLLALLHSKPLVGIIDTGFNAHHPHWDYSQFTLGHDYLDGDNNPLLEPGQGNEHGTQVLSVIEATQTQGSAGVYADTPFWLSRATGSGHWSEALNEFVDHARASGHNHAVVNLSFDLTQINSDGTVSTRVAFTPQELAALHYAHANHVLIVTAAGNQAGGMSALGQASQQFDNIITVGAAAGMARADYSSYGAGLNVLANGGTPEHPLLTTTGNDVGAFSGTSAAAAQVTGAVSLVWAANPDLSYRQVIEILEQTATDAETPGWDAATGFGMLNLVAAVDLAKQTAPAIADSATTTPAAADNPLWQPEVGAMAGERPTDNVPAATLNLLWRNLATGQDVVWVMNGASLSTAISTTTVADSHWRIQGTADFNHDGQTDILWRNDASGQNVIWQMNGTTLSTTIFPTDVSDLNWKVVGINDFNGDGQPDILWRNDSSGQNVVWLMNGTTLSTFVSLTAVSDLNWKVAGISDFNGDGQSDILWHNDATGQNVVWLMNGTTLSTFVHLPTGSDLNWKVAGIADFNGDGQPDILMRNAQLDQNAVWFMNGTTRSSVVPLGAAGSSGWTIAGVGDFDRDGKPDLFWRHQTSGQNVIWAMNGTTRKSAVTLPTLSDLNWQTTLFKLPLPVAPTNLALQPASDSGVSNHDNLTRVTTPTLTGKAGAGTVVKLFSNGQLVGQTTTATNGTWQITTSPLSAGNHALTATATDSLGLTSSVSVPLQLVIDTQAPIAPNNLQLSNDSGQSASDGVTNVATAIITGRAEAGATVVLSSDGQAVGQTTATAAGTWQITTSPLSTGSHALTATATDAAGNSSPASNVLTVVVDTQAPVAPTGVKLSPVSDTGGSQQDNVTANATPTIQGNAEIGALIKLYSDGQVVGQTTVDATGAWHLTAALLSDGSHQITTTATDTAGNVSPVSAPLTVVIDTQAPAIPSGLKLAVGSDSGQSSTDNITWVATPTVQGTAAAGTLVQLFSDGQVVGQTTVPAGGQWQMTTSTLADGAHALMATATDTAGNVSVASTALTVVVDTQAPTAPSQLQLSTASDTGFKGDNTTANPTPVITGRAEPNALIQLFHAGQVVGQATADATGLWQVTTTALVDGTDALTATATDTAGNVSPVSAPITVVIDTQAPATSDFTLAVTSDSGSSTSDHITQVTMPTITGTAEPGSHVEIWSDGQSTGQATVGATGQWQITTSTLSAGVHQLVTTVTDAAGNVSPTSAPLTIVIDTQPPVAPATMRLSATDQSASTTEVLTSTVTPTLTGSAEPGTVITLCSGGQVVGLTTVDAAGGWQVITSPLTSGTHSITATATDRAGNVSPTATLLTLTVDAITPTVILNSVVDNAMLTNDARLTGTVSGTGSAITSLTYHFDDQAAIPIALTEMGVFDQPFDFTGINNQAHTLILTAIDAAGNVTVVTRNVVVDRDTAPPQIAVALTTGSVTSQPMIAGTIADSSQVVSVRAGFENSPATALTDVTTALGSDGSFTLDEHQLASLYGGAFPAGIHTLSLQATDVYSNQASVSISFTVAPLALAAPHDVSMFNLSVGYLDENGEPIPPDPNAPTNFKTPLITGKAAPGLAIQLFDDGTLVGQATVDQYGDWYITTSVLSDGVHRLTAIATDSSGTVSPPSDPVVVTLDTQPPTTPTLQLSPSSDSGSSDSDLRTNATTLLLSGTAEPGMVVEILHEGFRLGIATAAADGTWQTTVTRTDDSQYQALTEYGYNITAVAADAAGNISLSAPLLLMMDTQAETPEISGLTAGSDTGSSHTDGITRLGNPTVTGRAEARAVVKLFSDEAALLGQAIADDSGNWQITTPDFEFGTHYLRAVATDIAGNVSYASRPYELSITVLDNFAGNGYGGEGGATAGGGYGSEGNTSNGSNGNGSSGSTGGSPSQAADDPDNAFVAPPSNPSGDPTDDPSGDPTDGSSGNSTPLPIYAGATPSDYPEPTQADLDVNYTTDFAFTDAEYDLYEGQPYGYRGHYRPTQPSNALHGAAHFTFLPSVYWTAYYIKYYQQDPPDPSDPNNPPLGPNTPPPDNTPPTLTYTEKLQRLLDRADSQLLGKRQAALAHYKDGLIALGSLVDQSRFYNFMAPVLGDVFETANWVQRQFQIKSSGDQLYRGLRYSDKSITEQVYQAKLFAAVKLAQVPKLQERLDDPTFIADLKALGSVYALSNPKPTAATAAELANRSFLAELWAAEDETSLQQSVAKLEQTLQTADDPAKVLHFLRTLLEAAQQVPALKAQLHDAKFMEQFVQLGLNYAALMSGQDNGSGLAWFCLDTLWNAQSPAEVRLGTRELTKFFQDLNSNDMRLKALTLDNNLIKAAQQVPALQEQIKDPEFIKALLELGHSYAETQPGGQQPIQFFLDTLYRAKNDTAIALGAQELTTFFQGFDTKEQRLQLLQFEHKLLQTADQVPALQEQEWLRDPTFTKELVNLGRTYASVKPSDAPTPGAPLNFFLDTVWRAQNKADINKGVAEFATFVKDVADPIRELSFANSLIETAQQSLTFKDNLSHRIDVLGGLVRLGGAYAALDPKAEDVEHFFLHSLWRSQDANTVALAARELDSWFELLAPATTQDPVQQVKLLGLERNLLQIVKQTPALKQQSQSPAFLQALTERGRTYAALYGTANPTDTTSTTFFFDLLWQQQDQGFDAAKTEFSRFVQALVDPNASTNSTQKFDPDALMFGLQLLLAAKGATLQKNAAEGATAPAILPATFAELTVPLAHIARTYTALNPDKQALTYDFFLNTLWQSDNTVSDQAQVQTGAEELAKFLGGGRFGTAFSPFEQADTLEFVAKTLKFVDLTPKLTETQKQDADILRRWVAMARAYAQLRPSDRSGAGNNFPDYNIIGLPPYFLDTLWQTPLDSITGIQDSIAQLDTLLTKLDIQDQLSWVELSAKFMKAWNYALEFVSADALEFLSNPFVYLCFGGMATALLAAQFSPALNVFVDAGLSVLLLVLTAITGTNFLSSLLQFIIGLKQADVNDEHKLREVGADLAHVLQDGTDLALTIFPQIPQAQALLKIVGRGIKVSDWLLNVAAANRGAVFKFLTKFAGNESVWQRFDSGTAGRDFLTKVAAYLDLEGKSKVLDLLAKDKDLNLLKTLLGKNLDDAKVFIDELNGLLNFKNTTIEQLLELLGKATIDDLKILLPGFADMTAEKLLALLGKASVEDLKDLLGRMSATTPAADLQALLNQMSVADLKGFLAQMSAAELQGFLNKGITVSDLQTLLATPGVTPQGILKWLEANPTATTNDLKAKAASDGYAGLMPGRVNTPGEGLKPEIAYADPANVPNYYSQDPRFSNLAQDPDHGFQVDGKSRGEAMAGLEAESQGLLNEPIKRGPKGIEFYDADGNPWDVKTPTSPQPGDRWTFQVDQQGGSIKKELREASEKDASGNPITPPGTFTNEITGNPSPRRVILDSSYLSQADHDALWRWLNQTLTNDELDRIVEIKVRP